MEPATVAELLDMRELSRVVFVAEAIAVITRTNDLMEDGALPHPETPQTFQFIPKTPACIKNAHLQDQFPTSQHLMFLPSLTYTTLKIAATTASRFNEFSRPTHDTVISIIE